MLASIVRMEVVMEKKQLFNKAADLAIEKGIIKVDEYSAVRYGRVSLFYGEGVVEVEGRRFMVKGIPSEGNAAIIRRFSRVDVEEIED